MASPTVAEPQPHAVLVPIPAQGHITPFLRLATLLLARGFHVTFVLTEYNARRLERARGNHWTAAAGPSFRVETIPDGLPPPLQDQQDETQDIPALCSSVRSTCLAPFRDLMAHLGRAPDTPPVTSIVSDSGMGFTVDEDFGVPVFFFFTHSACGCWSYLHFPDLVSRGYTPLKDASCLSNGYLDTPIDWIPGLENLRLRDFPSFIRTTDPADVLLNLSVRRASFDVTRSAGFIFNTFAALEDPVLTAIRSKYPNLYAIGPLSSSSISSSLWKEDLECLRWLDAQPSSSVLYVNFGSIAVVSASQLAEFACGLANSGHRFLWVVRPDLMRDGGAAAIVKEVAAKVGDWGSVVGWCDQQRVLAHPATAAFLSHCGWNSTIESVVEGRPMICWPFFAEQHTNCRFLCTRWRIGVEISGEVTRVEVERCVREVMANEDLRRRAAEWKQKAREAVGPDGSSTADLDRLVVDLKPTKKRLPS
ncbi:UDP-glycosyltransferase 85A3-like [Curcuma longa]|uniref:UDP-glycosyltransferase 85A3-like n=1 Tax=Curcuma longa TaxID=136217 RepID=UPI003D9DF839